MIPTKFIILGLGAGVLIAYAAYIYFRYRKENLAYLQTYDRQDLYKNRSMGVDPNPPWPIADTATTAEATILRDGIERDQQYYNNPSHVGKIYDDTDPLLEIPGAPYSNYKC